MQIEKYRLRTLPRLVPFRRVVLLGLSLAAFSIAIPRTALAFSDAEVATFLKRRFSCPVLAPGNMQSGQVRGADGPIQVFLYGAEGCPGLPFAGASFAAVAPGAGGMSLLTPQLTPTGVTAVTLRDGYVVTTSLDYVPSDPRCCPSRQVAQRWVVSGSRLVRAP